MRIGGILCALLVAAGLALQAQAQGTAGASAAEAPAGPAIVDLSFGAPRAPLRPLLVSVVNGEGRVLFERLFDLAGLDALPQTRIVTHTPWTHGLQTFTGPSLATFAGLDKVAPKEVRIYSLGDLSATVPAEDWQTQGVILASRLNGDTMRVRDKGPYWIMYPIDGRHDLDTQMYQARMVWQVKALEFVVE